VHDRDLGSSFVVLTKNKIIRAIILYSLLGSCCLAQTPAKVSPWNGHAAAISLTFDDARPVHLDVAVPELNKRHLRATFFVIVSKLSRIDDWRQLRSQGHEIGNHSASHEHPAGLNAESAEIQVEDAKKFLDGNFGTNISIFAYPYSETSRRLAFWVKKYDFAARSGCSDQGCDDNLFYITPHPTPDWYNIPSQPALTRLSLAEYKGWIDKAMLLKAWTILQIHGIGDPSTGWEPIPTVTFLSLLDYVKQCQDRGLWVAPFGEVAAYMRATDIFEHAAKQERIGPGANTTSDPETDTYVWEVPDNFPKGVLLKAEVPLHARIFQDGRGLTPDQYGLLTIAFDAKSLVVQRYK
jgi:peptidoglycan/xylan/chitin deacetylase (PgdA/CDA1 family)